MRNIVYYVATSLDGYIAGPKESIDGFVTEGSAVEKYLNDLQDFDTVIMGRKTYEFGYRFGLQPGRPAYPHMKHYIFSGSLRFEDAADQITVCPPDPEIIEALKKEKGTIFTYAEEGSLQAGCLIMA